MMRPSTHDISSLYLSSDLEEDRRTKKQQENSAEKALEAVGSLLTTADNALSDLERNDKLGSAIVRGCKDLADAIGGLADELDQQSDQERRALAKACMEDAVAHQDLLLVDETNGSEDERPAAMMTGSTRISSRKMTEMSEDDMMMALSGATSLLRDVEASFRSIDERDAEEIADLTLTLARLFLMSLQDLYSTVTPQDLVEMTTVEQSRGFSGGVEILDDEEFQALNSVESTEQSKKKKQTRGRMRALWPPLGPAVNNACQWTKEEAAKKPLLAVALGLTLWPMAIPAVLVGAPLVLADDFLQKTYDSFSDHGLVENLERGAAELYTAGRLCLVFGGLMTRQTLRVASRQIERQGGAGQVAQNLGGMALDRAMHPIETFGMAWNGISMGMGAIREAVSTVKDLTGRNGVTDESRHESNLYY